MHRTACRFCSAPLEAVFADLGMSPLANSYLPPERVNSMEPFYPLRALVRSECFLVQLEEFETPDRIFTEYAYFSSYSSTGLEHSRRYTDLAIDRFGLGKRSHVVEIASNDGYLLQYFHERQIPVLGIEPAAYVAKVALQKGIPTLVEFFGRETAASLSAESAADLLIGNNVLAHVPDVNDFDAAKPDSERATAMRQRERAAGFEQLDTYTGYRARVVADKRQILEFLIGLEEDGKRLVGYGAPARGNTLLNYCGVRRDFLDYTCDLNPHKQGHFLPDSHIPIRSPDAIREDQSDVVLILPWNLKDEIMQQLSHVREWGGRFAARTPELALQP